MRASAWLVLLLAAWASPLLAAGSWVGQAPGVRAVMVDRSVASASMAPPPGVSAGSVQEVRWRYQTPPGAEVRGWLCHPGGCIELGASQGRSEALAGLPAATPLHFRFALAVGQRRAAAVSGLQVIVNYR